MKSNIKKYKRRSIRIKDFSYSTPGAYFVTICTFDKKCILSKIEDGIISLFEFGRIAQSEWEKTARMRKNIRLDEFIIMPNHIHGIIFITEKGTARRAPTEKFGKPVSGSLPTILRSFKAAVTKGINRVRKSPGEPIWQRNYYEHIARDDSELDCIRKYIISNPFRWVEDIENPDFKPKKSLKEYYNFAP